MKPSEERLLKIALDTYDDDIAEVAVAVLQDELIEQWERGTRFNMNHVLKLVPWSMPFEHQWVTNGLKAHERPPERKVFAKRRWMAQTIAAYLLFRDWPHRWPLAKACDDGVPPEKKC